jgi:hypothetical protein
VIAVLLGAMVYGSGGLKILPVERLAREAFGNDSAWYEANIPFFECSDKRIQEIYYYRWRLFKAHIRDVGERGTVITEFLGDVPWQKWPFASLNDATPFHIRQARWLRDESIVNGYVDYLYLGGGNDRHFSEGIADATYQNYLAHGDLAFASRYLPVMRHIYNLWDDHFDFSKGLYWIEPLFDATEYTISSIDATGGRDGFLGGQAFRPTINAYQYGNARAISRLAALTHDAATSQEFARRANQIKQTVQRDLWSEKFQHFIDRHQTTNAFVKYWEPVRGRELEGYVPWAYELPDDNAKFAASWHHALSSAELGGPFGLRTVEPSYQYYMRQYRYLDGRPECQWNGPSWPFQTTQFLTGLANLLNSYHQTVVGKPDYLRLLRQYTDQHYVNGKPDLEEDYNPDKGGPIVGLDRSHHYNHSGYDDLVITGLCGVRPQENDCLVVNPLIPDSKSIPYFCLEHLPYHGHDVTLVWDASGRRYGRGKGLSVFVDGQRWASRSGLGRLDLPIGKPRRSSVFHSADSALNVARVGFPAPSASVNQDTGMWQAIDGRAWFFPEIVNGWSTRGSANATDWYALDYGRPTGLRRVSVQFYKGGDESPPSQVRFQAWDRTAWKTIATVRPVSNGPTVATFAPVKTSHVRVVFDHQGPARLVELETFDQ